MDEAFAAVAAAAGAQTADSPSSAGRDRTEDLLQDNTIMLEFLRLPPQQLQAQQAQAQQAQAQQLTQFQQQLQLMNQHKLQMQLQMADSQVPMPLPQQAALTAGYMASAHPRMFMPVTGADPMGLMSLTLPALSHSLLSSAAQMTAAPGVAAAAATAAPEPALAGAPGPTRRARSGPRRTAAAPAASAPARARARRAAPSPSRKWATRTPQQNPRSCMH